MKKLFYYITSLNIGGTEKFVYTLSAKMKKDCIIEVGYIKEKGYFGDLIEAEGIKVIKITSILALSKYLKENRFDAIHSFLYRANINARIAGVFSGISVVISTQRAIDRWKNILLLLIDRLTVPLVDAFLTNSKAAKLSMQKKEGVAADKITVINNGIDFKEYETHETKDELIDLLGMVRNTPIVVYAGRLHNEKGSDYLPYIAKNVTKDAIFLIIGDGQYRQSIEKKVFDFGLRGRFFFAGWRKDVNFLLKAADIFILPSREESFPQVLLESMYHGVPIVASDVGGVNEVVDNNVNGLLVKSGDVNGFAKAIDKLLNDKQLLLDMGKSARQKALLFSQDKMIMEMKKFYAKVIDA